MFWQAITDSAPAVFIAETPYVFQIIEGFHLIGVALFFGSIFMLDLRLLGVSRRLMLRNTSHHFLPVTWVGFGLVTISGLLLFISAAHFYVGTNSFRIKAALIVAGGINMLLFHTTTWQKVAEWDHLIATPPVAKLFALLSMGFWIATIVAGRWLGYEEQSNYIFLF